jgi:TolA-binding protein
VKKKILLALSIFWLFGCDMMMTRGDVKKQEEEKELKEQVSTIQKSRADNELRYSDLQNDIRTVAGRVDTLDHNQQVSNQNNKQEIESLKKTIEAQNEKIKLLEQHVDTSEQRLLTAMGSGETKSTSGAVKEGKKSDSDLFSEADALLAAKEFKRAIVKYQAYRDKYPKGRQAPEATYKIGVCFAELGLKKDAKEFYKETLDSYPGTPSAKKAKYRLQQLK